MSKAKAVKIKPKVTGNIKVVKKEKRSDQIWLMKITKPVKYTM